MKVIVGILLQAAFFLILKPLVGISQERRGYEILSRYAENKSNHVKDSNQIESIIAFDTAGNSSFQSDMACATTKPDSNSQPENKPTPALPL